ncbi:MAG: TetR/AcrR family transcriptional regulator [Desulfobacterales bacterium]|nr:TetR/AcrR family transcriptional regulator [Desulfobacterales bacterium]
MSRNKKSDIRKPEILKHLYQVLSKEGLRGTTLSKVARHMGVNPSLIIHYFKTKDDMFMELADAVFDRYEAHYFNKIVENGEPEESLEAIFDIMFDQDWDDTDESVYWALFYLGYRIRKVRNRDTAYRNRIKNHIISKYRDLHESEKTEVVQDPDPEAIALSIMAMETGLDNLGTIFGYNNEKMKKASDILKSISMEIIKGQRPKKN